MIQFYAPDIETECRLGQEDSAHCSRVLRMREGDSLRAVDGRGGVYRCVIVAADPKRTDLVIEEKLVEPRPWYAGITLAVAPTKNMDRMEWLVEKAVEIGVGRFVPLLCERSERKVIKTERLRKIAVSAMKQSMQSWLPEIDEITPFMKFVEAEKALPSRALYMGYCAPWLERRRFVDSLDCALGATILIGPEGDFTTEEVNAALAAGTTPVTFGDLRLRTETAALYSATATHILHNIKNP